MLIRLKAINELVLSTTEPCPIVAMLRPRSGLAQWLISEHYALDPWVPTTEFVDAYGNLGQRLIVPAGGMRIRVEALVATEDFLAVEPDAEPTPIAALPDPVLMFLLPSRYCPSDRMVEQAESIVQGVRAGYAQVEAIRRWLHANLTYQYGVSDASTDALDTLEKRSGVCRDFAHVGIALTRALNIPARQVVGYLHELDPMDMHAWFEAFIDGRWFGFDATQAEPRGARIVVGYGRDAADVAFISNYAPLAIEHMEVSVTCVDSHPAPL